MRFLTIILSLFLLVQTASAAPFNAKAKTKRIPAGTKFSLELLNPVSTSANVAGNEFTAIMITDQTADSDVILPMGSLVRGSIKKIEPAKRMSKGAVLYLDFDHVVTPNGRQLPLSLSIVGRTDMTYDGGITTTRGYKDALVENWHNTVDITKNATEWGGDVFDDIIVADQLMTGVGAIGGAIGGGAYYIYDGIADMIRKGKNVNLNKGDVVNVILVDPVDVPVI
ncbi:TPA: hypothetical protein CPT81_06785 [Candidatus Gastranaerophilales bacterium HUM_20]|jgi:hypothetical protein|nr:MAG: hypothetical protein BHW55_04455 [Candidatus Melainabacteria bacterium 35_41]CDE88414.1 putative uncharacterized protein [Clostridium sp. CAG:729]DAB20390.1 MAG TPA: hypothetical protein CPT81_06785 [Candidatus Gastranaerophilales bacterium HUM_20]